MIFLFHSFRNCSLYEELNNHVATLAEKRQLDNLALLSRDFHVLPDFHGNRSPIGDPKMTGMVLIKFKPFPVPPPSLFPSACILCPQFHPDGKSSLRSNLSLNSN